MPPGQHIGYIRVSTDDQNTARQLVGVELHRTFEDKLSGKDTKRPALREALAYLREGDTLHVHSIDRLARNLQDLLQLLHSLITRGVAVKFHKENLAFNGSEDPFQRLQLQVIGAVAEFERALIKERQREGIAAAKKKGKALGRKPCLTEGKMHEILAQKKEGAKVTALAIEFGVSRETIYKVLRRNQGE